MRGTPEIDTYPGNAKLWEIAEGKKGDGVPLEASEHIDGLFGSSSAFHRAHGFFIDGTDENTAKLPEGWSSRAIVRHLGVDGRIVKAMAPARGSHRLQARQIRRQRQGLRRSLPPRASARHSLIEERIAATDIDPKMAVLAIAYIRNLARRT
jgi:hypothetical protein